MQRSIVLLIFLVGCGSVAEPLHPESFTPPFIYVGWMVDVMECIGENPASASSRVEEISWYVVDEFSGGGVEIVWGEWDDGDIYLRRDAVGYRRAVVHEMIHDRLDGDSGHKDPKWVCQYIDWRMR